MYPGILAETTRMHPGVISLRRTEIAQRPHASTALHHVAKAIGDLAALRAQLPREIETPALLKLFVAACGHLEQRVVGVAQHAFEAKCDAVHEPAVGGMDHVGNCRVLRHGRACSMV